VTTDRDNILGALFQRRISEASFSATAERVSSSAAGQEAAGGNATSLQESEKQEQKEKKSKTAIEQAEAVRLVYHIQEGHKRACGEF